MRNYIRLIALLIFFVFQVSFSSQTKTITATLDTPWSEFENSDMHACCKGFCATELKASSFLQDKSKINYGAKMLADDKQSTAWVEGKADDGIGEWIEFNYTFDEKFSESAEGACNYQEDFLIANGYQKNNTAWKENNRVKKMKMYIDGKFYADIVLLDKMGSQLLRLGFIKSLKKKKAKIKIKFVIAEVYKGTKYRDTAITEIWW
ncbi:MAG TPA: hypothetical protein VK177_16860 [Flavobacteriales bacterium]|nr:hypothetical protein [Flavobacteriales bacterium]